MKAAKEIENKIRNLKMALEAAKSDFENKYYTAKELSEIELPTKQAIQFLEWVLNQQGVRL